MTKYFRFRKPNRSPHTEETKAKISAALKGREVSDETRAALRDARLGSHLSDKTKEKISQKMHVAMQGNTNAKRRPVLQLTPDGQVYAQYDSTSAAARALGLKNSSLIARAAKGKTETAYGYMWKFIEEENA